ncbi:AMP-binding protein [Actinoallomurus bryophytorum]|uniref:Fatty-acyl-CoA synthase n=1 Tax=Actinoallomurus bryophytorum TaxID=1490222 RepID=A0A543BTF7_9ACTN|nr:AMP-binding protein [Actinoallomurus bryophytorum]TQL88100.1 fatty-acyl-CoA synthase [Actinoallomurus bryophytorum]
MSDSGDLKGAMITESYWPADTSRPVLELTAGEVLRRAAEAVPSRTALIEAAPPGETVTGAERTDRAWTYAELLADAEHAAAWLGSRFSPGEHVAVWAPNVPEWVVLQYGASLAGLVLVTADPALREAELEYLLRQSGSVGVFHVDVFDGMDMAGTVDRVRAGLPELREVVSFTHWAEHIAGTAPRQLPRVAADDPAQIQYTAGTTGFPKGAVLHHRGLVTNAAFAAERAGFPDGGVWVTALPLSHTGGCGLSVLGAASARGTLVLARLFHPDLVMAAMHDWRGVLFAGTPAMYARLLANPEFDAYDVRACEVLLSGGDLAPAALVEEAERRFGACFSAVYGQTELSPVLAQTGPSDAAEDRRDTGGRPLWQAEVKIVDSSGAVVPVGGDGEICARGYQLMLEYFGMPEATALAVDPDGWLHTGDVGVLDERGYLRVTGRLKDMIVRGGERISPLGIEAALTAHPGVAAAAVVGVPGSDGDEQVTAVITPADPAPSAAELREFLRASPASEETPRSWYVADPLPANAMGRVQRFALRRAIADGSLPELP